MSERPFNPAKLPDAASMRNVPKLSEAVEGWRVWRVHRTLPLYGNPPKLQSVTHGKRVDEGYWTPRRAAEAICGKHFDIATGRHRETMPEGHVASMGCACGFYSARTLERLRDLGYIEYGTDDNHFTVIGKVACWGNVTEGRQGWRSQFCYPKALYVPVFAHAFIKPLRAAYGVPTMLESYLDIDLHATPAYPEV